MGHREEDPSVQPFTQPRRIRFTRSEYAIAIPFAALNVLLLAFAIFKGATISTVIQKQALILFVSTSLGYSFPVLFGQALAGGAIPIPFIKTKIQLQVYGGVAVFVIAFILLNLWLSTPPTAPQQIGQLLQGLPNRTNSQAVADIQALAQLANEKIDNHWEVMSGLVDYVASRALAPPEDDMKYEVPIATDYDGRYDFKGLNKYAELSVRDPPTQEALTIIGLRNIQFEVPSILPADKLALIGEAPLPSEEIRDGSREAISQACIIYSEDGTSVARMVDEINDPREATLLPTITKKTKYLSLTKIYAPNASFVNGEFSGADFSQADLAYSNFSHSHLEKATFDYGTMFGCMLWDCHLQEAHLRQADLRGAVLGTSNLHRAWLSGTNLFRGNLWRVDLGEAYMIGADCRELETAAGLQAQGLVCVGTDFSSAHLGWLEGTRLIMHLQAKEKQGQGLTPEERENLRKYVEEMRGNHLSFEDAMMLSCNFTGAFISNASFARADLRRSTFKAAELHQVDLTGAQLEQVDFNDVNLTECIGLTAEQLASARTAGAQLPSYLSTN